MPKPPSVLTQTQLTSTLRGFARAGLKPQRAVVKRDSTTLFFNPDLPDEAFKDDSDDPEAALAKWERDHEKG
jgi:hypothetical protein